MAKVNGGHDLLLKTAEMVKWYGKQFDTAWAREMRECGEQRLSVVRKPWRVEGVVDNFENARCYR
jgi:hypothetical protein